MIPFGDQEEKQPEQNMLENSLLKLAAATKMAASNQNGFQYGIAAENAENDRDHGDQFKSFYDDTDSLGKKNTLSYYLT